MCEVSMYDEFIADCLFELDFPFGLPEKYWTTYPARVALPYAKGVGLEMGVIRRGCTG